MDEASPGSRSRMSSTGGLPLFSSPPPTSENDLLSSVLDFDTPTSRLGSVGGAGSQGTPKRHRNDIASSYRIREVNLMTSDPLVGVLSTKVRMVGGREIEGVLGVGRRECCPMVPCSVPEQVCTA